MRVTVLTSSRADFGILRPLLSLLAVEPSFRLSLVAFGSHLDPRFGNTIDEILEAGFTPTVKLPPVLDSDTAGGITRAMAATMAQFGEVWESSDADIVVALGDRYEMFAAVASAVPFGLRVAHIHGGETTLGAIDNAFRHSITHMASLHFTAAEPYRQRVIEMRGSDEHVFNTGALSIDSIASTDFYSLPEIERVTGVDMQVPTALITFHPETVAAADFEVHWQELEAALRVLSRDYQLLLTMPNADTHGLDLRARIQGFEKSCARVVCVNSLGSRAYLSCMKYCSFLLGNSSSGYVEASYFPKHVIDIGARQSGRLVTANIHRCAIERYEILAAAASVAKSPTPVVEHPYGVGHAAARMIELLRDSG